MELSFLLASILLFFESTEHSLPPAGKKDRYRMRTHLIHSNPDTKLWDYENHVIPLTLILCALSTRLDPPWRPGICSWPVRSVGRDVRRRSKRREGSMKVHELMTEAVVEIHSHHTIDHVRKMITQRKVGALPVVDNEGRPVGIVSTLDLIPALDGGAHISTIMADKVDTIAEDSEVGTAARLMRTHQIHHLVVIYDQKVVGMLSAFDLLRLVEDYSV